MMKISRLVVLVFSYLGFCIDVMALETGKYPVPNMEGFVKIQEYLADGDEDGRKETTVRRFKNLEGQRMFSMTTKDQVWAWSRDSGGNELEQNYVLRDSNCDGTFDERYSLDEEFKVPDCLSMTYEKLRPFIWK